MDIKGFKDKDGTVHKYDYDALVNTPENGTVTDQRIAEAVEKYLTENPVDGVTNQQVYDAVAAYLTENPVEGVADEQIAQAVVDYLAKNPPASGDPGEDGGYYTPSMTQPDDETIRFDFTPSKEGMPAVEPVQVTLPVSQNGGQGSNGWSNEEIILLENILKKCVTETDQTSNIDALITMLMSGSSGSEDSGSGDDSSGTTFAVTLNLTDVLPSNMAQSVASGSVYVNQLSVADGYALGTPVITMGGYDVTSLYYDGEGTITINGVQGDIVITCKRLNVETLSYSRVSGNPDTVTFELPSAGGAYYVFGPSTYAGGKMTVDFDVSVLINWQFILYLYDSNGAPYKVSTGSGTASSDGVDITLMDPASTGFGYIKVSEPFEYSIPDGCTAMISVSRGSATSPDGSITSNGTFNDWIAAGGITVTVTEGE